MQKFRAWPKSSIAIFTVVFNLCYLNSAWAASPISSADDFVTLIRSTPDNDFELTQDIDLSELDEDLSRTEYVTETFSGTLEGNNYKITGLTKPLFSIIGSYYSDDLASVSNLTLITSSEGISGTGILANEIRSNTLIELVNVQGEINNPYANDIGGLVGTLANGWETNSSITKSSSSVLINGNSNLGGLVGKAGGGATISESYANGGLIGVDNIGGLVGLNYGTINESYANGSVIGSSNVGGLVGTFWSTEVLSNSYSSSPVTAHTNVGGLIGWQPYGSIKNSYALGEVTGTNNVGGLVGLFGGTEIINSTSTGDITGSTNVGTLVGWNFYTSPEIDSFGYGSKTIGDEFVPNSEGAQEILNIINRVEDSFGNKFELNSCFNKGLAYLSALNYTYQNSCSRENYRIYSNILQTERVERVSNTNGFVLAKPIFSKINFDLLPDKLSNSFVEVTGVKTSINQTGQVFLKVGEGLQIFLNSESKQPLQLWVRSPNGELILFGVVTFDENGKAVLPAIEFKNGGLFEFLFINSKENQIDQPDLINKVGGLTITVN